MLFFFSCAILYTSSNLVGLLLKYVVIRKENMDQLADVTVLETIVKSIVAKPEAVTIDRTVDERGVLLTLNVDPLDMGHLIGRQGTTIQAIRTILRIIGARNQARINIKIPAGEGREHREETMQSQPDSHASEVDKALDDLKL